MALVSCQLGIGLVVAALHLRGAAAPWLVYRSQHVVPEQGPRRQRPLSPGGGVHGPRIDRLRRHRHRPPGRPASPMGRVAPDREHGGCHGRPRGHSTTRQLHPNAPDRGGGVSVRAVLDASRLGTKSPLGPSSVDQMLGRERRPRPEVREMCFAVLGLTPTRAAASATDPPADTRARGRPPAGRLDEGEHVDRASAPSLP